MRTIHATTVRSDDLTDTWTASCSCGWTSVDQDGPAAASFAALSHAEFEAFKASDPS